MAEVWIPPKMQPLTDGSRTVQVEGETVRQIVNNLERRFPGTKKLLCDEASEDLLPAAFVIVDGKVNQLGMLERVQEHSHVHLFPAPDGNV